MRRMKHKISIEEQLKHIYRILLSEFGHRNWWPGDSPFEVMVGAILTQNTSWKNVEKAMDALKSEGMLSPAAIRKADKKRLRRLIRPSGYYNQKAEKLKSFVRFFEREYGSSIERIKQQETDNLREKLLSVRGIGEETADSILLYALEKPVFVVDAYTRRAFSRLGFLQKDPSYQETQELFSMNLPRDPALYNDFHAQIVYLGKDFCRKKPLCERCPLSVLEMCQPGKIE